MAMTWSGVTIKYILFLFNLVFVITGLVLLGVGISAKSYFNDYKTVLDDSFFSASNFLIAIGSIIFVISFLGCCGAVKENYCMIVSFTLLLIIIFILEFAAGITGFVLKGNTMDYLQTSMYHSLDKYEGGTSEVVYFWDEVQADLKCCGVNSYTDWKGKTTPPTPPTSPPTENPKRDTKDTNPSDEFNLPISCCRIPPGATGHFNCNSTTNPHPKGCLNAFGDFVESHAATIGAVAFSFAVIQLIGIFFAFHLTRQFRMSYGM